MTNGDILLKLLPFTHSDGATTSFSIFLEMSDWIITCIMLILLGIFVYFMLKMRNSKNEDEKKVDYLLQMLDKYKNRINSDYNDFIEDLKSYSPNKNNTNNDLYSLWNEFHESLIISTNEITNETLYRNSIDADYFFNKKTLLTHVGTKLYSTIPSILLGVGLMGTFLGLFVGLVQLNMNDSNTLKESMRALIHAAGVKFAASIWGLGLSLIFTIVEKRWENQLETKIEKIQEIINEAFERRTAEQSLEEISAHSYEQKNALNGLAATLTEKLSAEFNSSFGQMTQQITSSIDKSLSEQLMQVAQRVELASDTIAQQISCAIAESLSSPLSKIADAVEQVSKEQTTQSASVMEKLVENFISKIDEKAGGQSKLFKENIEQATNVMDSVTSNLVRFETAMNDLIEKQTTTNENRDKLILDNLIAIRDSQNETIQKLVDSISMNIQNLTENVSRTTKDFIDNSTQRETKLSEGIDSVIKRIDETTLKMENQNHERDQAIRDTLKITHNAIVEAAKSINDSSNNAIGTMSSQLNESVEKLKTNIDEILKNIVFRAKEIDGIIFNSSQKFNNIPQYLRDFENGASKLSSFASTIENGSDKLNDTSLNLLKFKSSLGEFVAQIDEASKQMKDTSEYTKLTAFNTKETYIDLASQYKDLLELNKISMEKFESQFESYRKQLSNSADMVFVSFDKQLSEFASGLASAVEELKDSIEELTEIRGNK